MKYDVIARNNDKMVYEDSLTAIFEGIAKRPCNCAKCGSVIFSGEERMTACFERQPKGVHYHINCFAKCGYNEESFAIDGHNNAYNSKCRENHTIVIYAKKWDYGYYSSLGFDYRGICFVKEVKNGYSEKVIAAALKNGNKVRVNGEEVKTAEEYRKMTLRG